MAKDTPEGDRVKVRELAAVAQMACTVHEGSYDGFTDAYGRLLGWIETRGYRIVGPNREIYIKGPGAEYEPSEYVTEIQFPVEKA
jgi:effector-binding domain-containing protein